MQRSACFEKAIKQHQFYRTYLGKENKEGAVKSGNKIAVDILVEIYDEILKIVSIQ